MGAPDKIFIKLIPSEHGGYVYSTACNGDEYVRKDALLEWAKDNRDSAGKLSYTEFIDKIESL